MMFATSEERLKAEADGVLQLITADGWGPVEGLTAVHSDGVMRIGVVDLGRKNQRFPILPEKHVQIARLAYLHIDPFGKWYFIFNSEEPHRPAHSALFETIEECYEVAKRVVLESFGGTGGGKDERG